MHSASLAPQMETSLESKFSAAFEQQNASSGSTKSQLYNGGHLRKSAASSIVPSTTTATAKTESSGEKTVSFRKGNDLESFESLSALFANGLFTDLVICCTGKMFKCHRVVMAAASLYIRDALSAFYNNSPDSNSSCNNCNTVMILPNEIKMSDMEAILRFIYDGHVEVKVDSIESFLRSARTLNIKGLANVNIVYNSNGTSEESFPDGIEVSASVNKNNGYSKGHSILNGHTGMNSPPPSPPSLNSSLASLKALANAAPSATVNGNHIGSKLLNGTALNNSLINQFRNSSPLRNESSMLGHNLTPAHQSSTPKSIFANGNLFNNNLRFDPTNNSQVASSGSRRKQKFPTSIPPSLLSDIFPALPATALYNSLLGLNSEEDDEEDVEEDDKKSNLKEDNSSNDCSTTGDNLSTCSVDTNKHPSLPFGVPLGVFNPQMPCMIEVEADPTTFPTYCQDMNDTSTIPAQQKKRRPYKTVPYGPAGLGNGKKLKLPYGAVPGNSGLDVSIKPASPLMGSGAQVAAAGLLSKKHGPSITSEKPIFSPFPSAKTAAGANPYAAPSPSSSSENWAASKWKCDICNKYYGNKQTLKEHMDYFHSNREEQIYICNICNKEYTWRKSLMKHYRDIHQMRNTPALAEINRQLAALATAKVRPSGVPVSPSVSNDNVTAAALQSMVSIANYNQNSNLESSAKSTSSNNSEKSNRSESEVENENTSDNAELRIKEEEEEEANEEIEMASSSPTPTDPESGEHNESGFHESKSSLSSPEKTNGSKSNGSAAELSDNSSSALVDRSSPASSLASS